MKTASVAATNDEHDTDDASGASGGHEVRPIVAPDEVRKSEGMFTLDETGAIIASSPSAAKMFGIPADALPGMRFAKLLAKPHRIRWETVFRRLRDGANDDEDDDRREVFAIRYDDGGTFPVTLATSRMINGSVHRYVAIVHDRTRERQLERRLNKAQEEERRRIGHELHDSVGGQLTGVEIVASLLHKRLHRDGSPHTGTAAEIVEHLHELHSRVRDVSRGLQPVVDDPLGLMTALRRLTKMSHGLGGTRCLFRCDEEVEVDDHGIAVNVYYIAEEAVQNAVLHAHANQIVIELRRTHEGRLVLTVSDDGIGIQDAAGTGDGIGMDSMAHRAALIGAGFEIERVEPSGTLVRCEVLLRDSEAPA